MSNTTDTSRHPHPTPHPAPPPPDEDAEDVILQVRMRPELVARMRAFAAREGASVEALAALWLEEKLAEAGHAGGSLTQATD